MVYEFGVGELVLFQNQIPTFGPSGPVLSNLDGELLLRVSRTTLFQLYLEISGISWWYPIKGLSWVGPA